MLIQAFRLLKIPWIAKPSLKLRRKTLTLPDTKQLLVQLNDAIDIFELKHPLLASSYSINRLRITRLEKELSMCVEPQNDTYYTKVGEPQRLWTEELEF
jgi:hypothetical protein